MSKKKRKNFASLLKILHSLVFENIVNFLKKNMQNDNEENIVYSSIVEVPPILLYYNHY
jgi:hypothetical protein